MSNANRKLPPYGRELMDLRYADRVPVNDIAIAAGWHRAGFWSPRVVVPDNEDPDAFDFLFVQSLNVIIFADTRMRADEIAIAVARFEPRILLATVLEPPSLVSYIRSDGKRGVLR